MRLKLLIATEDTAYAEHLSAEISVHHADVIDVTVCGVPERLSEVLKAKKYDAALIENSMIDALDKCAIAMPMLLKSEDDYAGGAQAEYTEVKKYQRISSIVAEVLEQSARVSAIVRGPDKVKSRVTAVWSPAGGVGKTAVSLAYAAKRVAEGKNTLYLNLETFSSVPAYFADSGKSISAVFEVLENNGGNIQMLIKGIQRQDSSGLHYLCRPDNFDDMNVLTVSNVSALVNACAGVTDELVIDMSCVCDERARAVFELADVVLLVTDQTSAALTKMSQFATQHKAFSTISEKTTLVENKDSAISMPPGEAVIRLPPVRSTDPTEVYKALSAYF